MPTKTKIASGLNRQTRHATSAPAGGRLIGRMISLLITAGGGPGLNIAMGIGSVSSTGIAIDTAVTTAMTAVQKSSVASENCSFMAVPHAAGRDQ
jgi:hypothetical protein